MAYYQILLLSIAAYFCRFCDGEEIKAKAFVYFTNGEIDVPPSIYVGSVIFTQTRGKRKVQLSGNLDFSNMSPETLGLKHGFHIHEIGSLGNGCKDAMGHYNPTKKNHGGPMNSERHVGDLGNVQLIPTGAMSISIADDLIALYGDYSIIGRALVIHRDRDDLGKGNASDSLTTGHAGPRIACGIIGVVSENYVPGGGSSKVNHAYIILFFCLILNTFLSYV